MSRRPSSALERPRHRMPDLTYPHVPPVAAHIPVWLSSVWTWLQKKLKGVGEGKLRRKRDSGGTHEARNREVEVETETGNQRRGGIARMPRERDGRSGLRAWREVGGYY